MSYFHNSYSTLEDAWGADFGKKKQQKKRTNSVCNLYESRDAPVTKPYVSRKKKHSTKHSSTVDDDEHFNNKYYASSAAHTF